MNKSDHTYQPKTRSRRNAEHHIHPGLARRLKRYTAIYCQHIDAGTPKAIAHELTAQQLEEEGL